MYTCHTHTSQVVPEPPLCATRCSSTAPHSCCCIPLSIGGKRQARLLPSLCTVPTRIAAVHAASFAEAHTPPARVHPGKASHQLLYSLYASTRVAASAPPAICAATYNSNAPRSCCYIAHPPLGAHQAALLAMHCTDQDCCQCASSHLCCHIQQHGAGAEAKHNSRAQRTGGVDHTAGVGASCSTGTIAPAAVPAHRK